MNHLKSCIYPIFFSGIGFIVYRSYRYNQDILKKQITLDKFNDPDYNPFVPQKPN